MAPFLLVPTSWLEGDDAGRLGDDLVTRWLEGDDAGRLGDDLVTRWMEGDDWDGDDC